MLLPSECKDFFFLCCPLWPLVIFICSPGFNSFSISCSTSLQMETYVISSTAFLQCQQRVKLSPRHKNTRSPRAAFWLSQHLTRKFLTSGAGWRVQVIIFWGNVKWSCDPCVAMLSAFTASFGISEDLWVLMFTQIYGAKKRKRLVTHWSLF